jgi:signal peptidase
MQKMKIILNGLKHTLWPIIQVGFFLAIILIALLIVSQKFSLGGHKFLIVQTGSMKPSIPAGSLVFVSPIKEVVSPVGENTKDLRVGDVITYKNQKNPNLFVTHRVKSIAKENGQILIETKGDANNAADVEKVRFENVVGKVLLAIPFLGFPVAFARTIPGYVLMIIIPALAIILSEAWVIKKEIEKYYARKFSSRIVAEEAPKQRRFFKRLGKSLVAFLIFFFVGFLLLGTTKALFLDQEKIEGNSISTWVGENNDGENNNGGDGNGNNGNSPNQITICHHTGSDTNPWEEITINENAWPAHEQHGDTQGPCPPPAGGLTLASSSGPTDTEGEGEEEGNGNLTPTPTPTPIPTVTPTPTPGPDGNGDGNGNGSQGDNNNQDEGPPAGGDGGQENGNGNQNPQ